MPEATVCHLLRGNNGNEQVLLGERNKLFNRGIWEGSGGKKWRREKIPTCARRESREEIGVELDIGSMEHFATVDYYHPFQGNFRMEWRVHFLRVRKWSGEPQPVDGFNRLAWYSYGSPPYEIMMPDYRLWLPISQLASSQQKLMMVEIYYADPVLKTIIAKMVLQFVDKT